MSEDDRRPHFGEVPHSSIPGQRLFSFPRGEGDPNEILSSKIQLKKHPELNKVINEIHDAGGNIWGYWDAHKRAFVLTIFAAGIAGVGIGTFIKKRKQRGKE